ncbi:recombinase family protein [Paenibacillus sp. FSL H8-0034]|uniref:recombinase family protein n=1 Tax=Paenibacillus sp. FSL H8-0034 TaxID=2954671 RepID=UPI0030FABD4D
MENQQQTCVKHTRVAIYARTNRNEHSESSWTIEEQVEKLKSHCHLEGKEIVSIFSDKAVSGIHVENQHSLLQLLEAAKQGLFDEMLVCNINRVARTTADILEIAGLLDKHGVTFTSISEKFDTSTRMGKFTLQMMAAIAEFEEASREELQ